MNNIRSAGGLTRTYVLVEVGMHAAQTARATHDASNYVHQLKVATGRTDPTRFVSPEKKWYISPRHQLAYIHPYHACMCVNNDYIARINKKEKGESPQTGKPVLSL